MQERGKEDKMRGGGCEKNLRGRYAGEGGGVLRKKFEGVCRRGLRRQNAGGGCCKKKLRGGYPERGKEDKVRGVVKKIWGGLIREGKEDKMRGVLRKN